MAGNRIVRPIHAIVGRDLVGDGITLEELETVIATIKAAGTAENRYRSKKLIVKFRTSIGIFVITDVGFDNDGLVFRLSPEFEEH